MPIPLTNFGNTCYLNSIIQGILGTLELENYFKNDLEGKFELAKQQLDHSTIKRMITYNIYKIFKGGVIDKYLLNLRLLFNHYSGDEGQQDSQEFLNYILDKIHEETKKSLCIEYNNVPDNVVNYWNRIKNLSEDEIRKIKLFFIEEDTVIKFCYYWHNFLNKNYSIIVDVFGCIYVTEIKCSSCNNISVNYEYMITLPLSIENEGNNNLDDLLGNYCKVEILKDDNMYYCEICNKKTIATKMVKIWNLSKNLIILIKKYSNNLTKTNSIVKYPFNINLKSYIYNLKIKYWNDNYEYELYNVTNHIGTVSSGHYYAYNRSNNDEWYKCDDETITKVNKEEVSNCNGYILWYKKK